MTPMPSLPDLISEVEADSDSSTPLDQLAAASAAGNDLNATTDALIGHFVERARAAGHTWVEISAVLGVSKQAVHKRFAASTPDFAPIAKALDRFTARTLDVLRAAEDEARDVNGGNVDSGHILLAMYAEPVSVATTILATRGVTHDTLKQHYPTAAASAFAAPTSFRLPGDDRPDDQRVSLGTDGVALLAGALQAALSQGHNYIGTEHLLLAAHQVTTIAGRMLDLAGVHRSDVEAGVEAALARHVAARKGTSS